MSNFGPALQSFWIVNIDVCPDLQALHIREFWLGGMRNRSVLRQPVEYVKIRNPEFDDNKELVDLIMAAPEVSERVADITLWGSDARITLKRPNNPTTLPRIWVEDVQPAVLTAYGRLLGRSENELQLRMHNVKQFA